MIKVFRYELNGYQTTRPHIISFFLFFYVKGMFLTFLQNVRQLGHLDIIEKIFVFFYIKYQKYVHMRIQRMQKKYLRCSRTSHYMNKYKRRIMSSCRQWLDTSQQTVVVIILQLF